MYFASIVACLLLTFSANGHRIFHDTITLYNPCKSSAGKFFYPDPVDVHKYYQCDESGIAYSRSCGTLVWDDLRTACNWASAALPSSMAQSVSTTTLPLQTSSTTTTTTTTIATVTSTTQLSWWSITTMPATWWSSSTTVPTIVQSSSSNPTAPLSLCRPINPCGEHGECIESPLTIAIESRRFACLCDENWFGKLCDKHIDELTTPSTAQRDQPLVPSGNEEKISLPIKTEDDIKTIFFGLKDSPKAKSVGSLVKTSNSKN